TRPPAQRSHLVDRSLALENHRLTIVSGPAGSGKSTLLTGWYGRLQRAGASPAWFTFDRRRISLPSALERLAGSLRESLGVRQPRNNDPELDLLCINDSVPAASRVLFLDDIGFVEQPIVEDLVEFMITLPGPAWRIVAAGRRPLRAPLSLAQRHEVRAIGAAQLRLATEAVAEVVATYRPDLTESEISTLAEQLGGWAAGAHLVGQALAAPAVGGERIDGSHIEIADYLETEVFSGLRPRDQDFLVRSSILDQPTAEGCRAVTADHFSAARLAALGRQHAFLTVDDDGAGYSWMPMARDFLRAKLPAEATLQARRRALNWTVETRMFGEAIEHAVELEDWDGAVNVLLDAGLDILITPSPARIVSLTRSLPVEVLEQEAGVAVVAAAATWALGGEEWAAVDDWLDFADAHARGRPPAGASSLRSAIDIARASFGSITSPQRRRLAQRALDEIPSEATIWRALALAAKGTAAHLDGEPFVARDALVDCLRLRDALVDEKPDGVGSLVVKSALGTLALLELDSDESARAEALLSAGALVPSSLPSRNLGTGTAKLARARCAFARTRSQPAIDDMATVGDGALVSEVRVLAFLAAAAASWELHNEDDSGRFLAEAERQMDSLNEPGRLLRQWQADVIRQLQRREVEGAAAGAALTEREVEVLRLLDSELSRREIAGNLFLAHNTVKTYIQRLYQKLGVSSRPAAVAEARDRGWLP
ncbi:MAG: LuxR C-terminal-related transcriptional regulator, partial [Acidimicrobiales bacterium]